MPIVLDHTIVPAYDNEASARFFARIFGLQYAVNQGLGFALPMMVCASGAIICYIASLLAWPDTRGQEMVADLQLLPAGLGDD